MPRFVLTSLGVLGLLFSAPDHAGAAELVRAGTAPSALAVQVEVPAHGAAPRQAAWTDVVSGTHLGSGLPSRGPRAPVAPALHAAPTASAPESGADLPHVLPDARAPPA